MQKATAVLVAIAFSLSMAGFAMAQQPAAPPPAKEQKKEMMDKKDDQKAEKKAKKAAKKGEKKDAPAAEMKKEEPKK
jgi:hypothetical protein